MFWMKGKNPSCSFHVKSFGSMQSGVATRHDLECQICHQVMPYYNLVDAFRVVCSCCGNREDADIILTFYRYQMTHNQAAVPAQEA